MDVLGIQRAADLHRISEISESTISRIFFQEGYFPDQDVLEKLARALQVPLKELVLYAYRLDEIDNTRNSGPKLVELHPRAAKLNAYLQPDSHLTDEERHTLDLLADRIMAAYPEPRKRTKPA